MVMTKGEYDQIKDVLKDIIKLNNPHKRYKFEKMQYFLVDNKVYQSLKINRQADP